MKKIITAIAISAVALSANSAKLASQSSWKCVEAEMNRVGDEMKIYFDLDLAELKVPSEEALLLTPYIIGANDSIPLSAVGVYGRNRYYHYLRRDDGRTMLSGRQDEMVFKYKDRPNVINYAVSTPYQPWMKQCKLVVKYRDYGCCFTVLNEGERELSQYEHFEFTPMISPSYVAADATAEVTGEHSGAAWVQFVVNKTDLRPEMYNNPRELGKIINSIDTVRQDPDMTITEVWLKGFASPESPYSHNTDLARGRVQTLKDYLVNNHGVDAKIITTEFEPEDWAGLRQAIVDNVVYIPHKDEILEIIDTPMDDLDAKEKLIKTKYPKDYQVLLKEVYPPLRHTEYKVKYKVRRFYDIDEIKRKMKTEPYKLTLNDFNLAANTYAPGSPEFQEVYDIAVRMYPNDPLANLNAANSQLQAGNLDVAAKYLEKAGESAEADFTRGILRSLRGEYEASVPYLERAAKAGVPNARETLDNVLKYLNQSK